MSAHGVATQFEKTRVGPGKSAWVRWLLPSIADVIFLVLTGILVFSGARAALLADADTGWHLRNGEHILLTHSVPRSDYFSASKSGQQWYAWEWMWDAAMAGVHARTGLLGVVAVTGMLIAVTFAVLFKVVLARSGDFVVAAVLAMLAAFASQVHMLARPHVVSWLMTVLWLAVLCHFQRKHSRLLWTLPLLTVVWANLHGGFVIGFGILASFVAGEAWNWVFAEEPAARAHARHALVQLAAVSLACAVATLATPYGYRLHLHLAHYLSNSFLMDNISEFLSPNFHVGAVRWFEVMLLLVLVVGVHVRDRVSATDVFLVLLGVHAGLYAARNIPLAAIMISIAASPWVVAAIATAADKRNIIGAVARELRLFSRGMGDLETSFRGHILAIVVVVGAMAIASDGGHIGSYPVWHAGFSPERFPVRAADAILARHIPGPIFTRDAWSGFLIYRLYPAAKLFVDDRHDFYGEAFMKEYVTAIEVRYGWNATLTKWGVNWVLIDPDSPLANALKLDPHWDASYDDGVAILFHRRQPEGQEISGR